jgi:hypothetical protein
LDAAYAESKREAESLYVKKQHQLSQLKLPAADSHTINEHLASGRKWLADYMQQLQAGGQAVQSVTAKLEAATLSVWFRDLLLMAHRQIDPADEVQPRLNLQDIDENATIQFFKNMFQLTDPKVLNLFCLSFDVDSCSLIR